MIGKAIQPRLAGDSAIIAIVGTRIRPIKLAQHDVYPAVRYEVTREEHDNHISHSSGLSNPIVTIDCFASEYDDAYDLADLVRLRMIGWSGESGGITVVQSLLMTSRDIYVAPLTPDDVGVFGVSLEFSLRYREAIA